MTTLQSDNIIRSRFTQNQLNIINLLNMKISVLADSILDHKIIKLYGYDKQIFLCHSSKIFV
jgi:hypothetical protein